ncbi:MAG TPA: redoxin domain-containing protein [Anaerolineales bacterium]|nr:redoxin domain-containing protein [Anaerolineales bacterium]
MSFSPASILAPTSLAPDFTLPSTINSPIRLSDLRGKPVILVFYPEDFTPVCGDQLTLYNELLWLFAEFDAQILGISGDSLESHLAFSADRKLDFPLLADSDPLGEVARRYGVFDEESQTCERALFVIDRTGRIAWSYLSPRNVDPGADGILRALESLPA